ncbi:MAG TPA: glycosyltransferase family 1 protein [Prolixibacteraceae bacterium]|nr:glycosyltransferase family 1 protein [Prolixibacteraceae bacterium]
MRIVIIADSVDIQNAGVHVYTRNMIEALQNYTNHEIICIRHGKRADIHFDNDVLVKPLLRFVDRDPFRTFFLIPRAIKKLNPDCVIEPAHFGPFNLPKHIKRVTIIHDLTPIKFPQWHKWLSAFLQKKFLPSILKHADKLVVNSHNTLSDLTAHYPFTSDKTIAIYPGINPLYFSTDEEQFEKKQPFFLYAGTIEPRKNLIKLLTAFEMFRRNSKKFYRLVIVGSKGWKTEDFYLHLKNHPYRNDIELKGYVSQSELQQLYHNTSAFIFPSFYEGFGFPVAEAMVSGAPCIVSKISSLPEVGGDAVLYFNPFSAGELAEKMELLVNSPDLQRSMIAKGYEQARNFSWSKFASRFDTEVLKKLSIK